MSSSDFLSTSINTPHPTASRQEEWGGVLDSSPAFQLPEGGMRSRVSTIDSFRCFSIHGVAVRYSADPHDLKWLSEFNARNRPAASGRGKTGTAGVAPVSLAVTIATLEDAITLLELVHFYRPVSDVDQIHFPSFVEGERVFGVPVSRLEKVSPSMLGVIRDYWAQKRKVSLNPLIPSLNKGTLSTWGEEHPDPFTAREWECPVVVQEPQEEVVEGLGLDEFDERLSDAIECGVLRDSIAAVDSRLSVYSLALARNAAIGGSSRFAAQTAWDGCGILAVDSVLGL